MSDLDLMRPMAAFVAVVEAGSFRAGAERLGLSPPYVSQLVSDLEIRLGKQLLFRSTRRLALTEAGQSVLAHAQTMTQAFQATLDTVRSVETGLTGQLRVSVPTVLANQRFARIIGRFTNANPALRLEIDLEDRSVNPIEARVDLVIRIGDPSDNARLGRRLFLTQGIVVVGDGLQDEISTPADLETMTWIRSPASSGLLTLVHFENGERIKVKPAREIVVNDAAMIRILLAETASFALFPEFSVRDALAGQALRQVLHGWGLPDVPVTALYTEKRTGLSTARAFVQAIQQDLDA